MKFLIIPLFKEPFVLLGIFFMIVGGASLLFKAFNTIKPGIKYMKSNQTIEEEKRNSKKVFIYVLIAVLVVLIVFIYWLSKMSYE